MRRLLLLLTLGLVAGVLLINAIEQDAGYVFISLGNITLETSVWFALFLWLVAWALVALLLRLSRLLLRSRHWVSGWVDNRKSRNAGALTNRGLISFIEGHWGRARRQLLRSARYSEAPLVNHLLAAQASFRLGDIDEMRKQLGAAEAVDAGAGIALELTQAELQLSAGHYEQALATLVRARANANKHPHVLELLARAHWALADWEALRALLPELRKHNLLEAVPLSGLEAACWYALVDTACARGDDIDALRGLWQTIPLAWRETLPLASRYIRCLITRGALADAEKLLIAALDRHWEPELVALVGSFEPQNRKKLDKAMGRWLEQYAQDGLLLIGAARLAHYRGEWQQACASLESALALKETASICIELARLHEASAERTKAANYLRLAAKHFQRELPLLPLPVEAQK